MLLFVSRQCGIETVYPLNCLTKGFTPTVLELDGVNPQTETGFSTSQSGATISSGWTTRELSRQPRLRVSTEAVHRRNSNSFLSDGMPNGVIRMARNQIRLRKRLF